jgi:hypothetical protein
MLGWDFSLFPSLARKSGDSARAGFLIQITPPYSQPFPRSLLSHDVFKEASKVLT